MTLLPRRIEISFDREREALQSLSDAISKLGRSWRIPGVEQTVALVLPALPQNLPWLDDSLEGSARPAPVSKASRYLATLGDAYGPLPSRALAVDSPLVDTIVLDASGLIALARGNVRARAHIARAVASFARIVIPATTLRTDAQQRIAESVGDVVPVDDAQARLAAALLVRTPGADPYVALTVAALARADHGAIVTAQRHAVAALVRSAERPNLYVFSV